MPALVYGAFFIGRKKKKRSDYLKLLYVSGIAAAFFAGSYSQQLSAYLAFGSFIVLWLAFIDVIWTQRRSHKEEQEDEVFSFDTNT